MMTAAVHAVSPSAPLVIQAVFFIALLLAASAIDIRKRIIPDSVCALVALTGLICDPTELASVGFAPVRLFGQTRQHGRRGHQADGGGRTCAGH